MWVVLGDFEASLKKYPPIFRRKGHPFKGNSEWLVAQFHIRGIPNCKFFHHGVVVAELSGALPEPQLRAWLAEHLPTPKRESMARARELLQAGSVAVDR